MSTEQLARQVEELTRQVDFCNNMTIVLSIGFYMVILGALLCSYIFIRTRLEMKQVPPPPPTIIVQPPQTIELERLLAKLLERLPLPVVAPTPPPVVAAQAPAPVAAPEIEVTWG
jgi:hypothetical protein